MKLLCPHCGSSNITATVSATAAQDQPGETLYSCSACKGRCTMDELLAYSSSVKAKEDKKKAGTALYASRPAQSRPTPLSPGKTEYRAKPAELMLDIEHSVRELERFKGINQNSLYFVNSLAQSVKALDGSLKKSEEQQAYSIYKRLCELMMRFGSLPVSHFGSSTDSVKCRWTGKHDYIRKYRIETWISRALVLGTLAKQLEKRQNESLHGEEYRQMAFSLWAKSSEYNDTGIFVANHADLTQWVIDRIIDYKIIGKAEKRLRRQIQDKLSDPKARVDLTFTPQNRSAVQTSMTVHTFIFLLVTGGAIVWLNDSGILPDIIHKKCLNFYDLYTKHPKEIGILMSVMVLGTLFFTAGTLFHTLFSKKKDD